MGEPGFLGLPQVIQEPHLSLAIGAGGQGLVCASLAPAHLPSPGEAPLICLPLSERSPTRITDGQVPGCLQLYQINLSLPRPSPTPAKNVRGQQVPLLLGSLWHLPSFGFSVSRNPAFLVPALPPSKIHSGVPRLLVLQCRWNGGASALALLPAQQVTLSGPRTGASAAYSALRGPEWPPHHRLRLSGVLASCSPCFRSSASEKLLNPQCRELSYEEEGLDQWILRSMTKGQAENYRARCGGDNPSRAQTRNQKRNQGDLRGEVI